MNLRSRCATLLYEFAVSRARARLMWRIGIGRVCSADRPGPKSDPNRSLPMSRDSSVPTSEQDSSLSYLLGFQDYSTIARYCGGSYYFGQHAGPSSRSEHRRAVCSEDGDDLVI
jgi:hypothetical protein